MFKLKSSLLKKFAFFSMIAFTITGIVLGVIISLHVKGSFEVFMPAEEFKQHIVRLN